MPKGSLNAAVNRLIEDVRTKVFGKHKLEDDDIVTVAGRVELSCDIFDRLSSWRVVQRLDHQLWICRTNRSL
jgi:hypothetical protein